MSLQEQEDLLKAIDILNYYRCGIKDYTLSHFDKPWVERTICDGLILLKMIIETQAKL